MADDCYGAIGKPATRIDGALKVTGQARYPSDEPLAHPAYAVLVTSAIARSSSHAAATPPVPTKTAMATRTTTRRSVVKSPSRDGAALAECDRCKTASPGHAPAKRTLRNYIVLRITRITN